MGISTRNSPVPVCMPSQAMEACNFKPESLWLTFIQG
jgi:hypothetical protein